MFCAIRACRFLGLVGLFSSGFMDFVFVFFACGAALVLNSQPAVKVLPLGSRLLLGTGEERSACENRQS